MDRGIPSSAVSLEMNEEVDRVIYTRRLLYLSSWGNNVGDYRNLSLTLAVCLMRNSRWNCEYCDVNSVNGEQRGCGIDRVGPSKASAEGDEGRRAASSCRCGGSIKYVVVLLTKKKKGKGQGCRD